MTVPDVGVDPDPDSDSTPATTPWQEYLAAAQALDAVVRQGAAEAAAAAQPVKAAQGELARVQAALQHQRVRIAGAAVRAGLAPPLLVPTPAEQARAYAQAAAGPPAGAVQHAHQLIGMADAQLAVPPAPARWRPPLWLWIAVPTVAAVLLVCVLGLFSLLL